MKDMEWSDEYALGIPAIDLQHRRIFDRFKTIAAGSTELDRMLAEFALVQLVSLLGEHFAIEESMMRSLCYPELERHIEEHRQFHAEVRDFAHRSLRKKESVSREAIRVTQKWLREHIMTSDRHYTDFFSSAAYKNR
jgi:hemerythrin-like metal-binding protein